MKDEPSNSVRIGGSVNGIGNVIGSHSSAHVEIHKTYNLFSVIKSSERGTRIEHDPRHIAISPTPFDPHPDAIFPELKHLIGHRNEIGRLLQLYDRANMEGNGAVVFVTGQHGYGTKALGRTIVAAVNRGGGLALYTRFWPEKIEERTRRDPRWREEFETYAEMLQFAPEFLQQPEYAPFWPLIFQICKKYEWVQYNLPHQEREIPPFLRQLAYPGHPMVIALEDFEYAPKNWINLLRFLTPELANGLPVLFIVSMHTEKPLDRIPAEQLSLHEALALELARQNQAEVYHLSRVRPEDIADYLGSAHPEVVEHLYRLSGGLPILVQDLWEEWTRTAAVIQDEKDKKGRWILAAESPLRTLGSGRDYVRRILEDLWPFEDEAPWSLEQMWEMLILAAREGIIFTPEALALAYGVELDKLIMGWNTCSMSRMTPAWWRKQMLSS